MCSSTRAGQPTRNNGKWCVRSPTSSSPAKERARGRAPSSRSAIPKQSIYGFQRADPAKIFGDERVALRRAARGAGQAWKRSAAGKRPSRSTAPVLAAVDAVFAGAAAARGVVFEGRAVRHEARRAGPGRASRIVGGCSKSRRPKDRPRGKPPIGRVAARDAADELAKRVAEHIAALCNGPTHSRKPRPAGAAGRHSGARQKAQPLRPTN